MKLYNNRARLFVVLTVVIISIVTIWQLTSNKGNNPYGDQLEIANLDQYTSKNPSDQDTLYFIKHNLFNVVSLNVESTLTNNSIKDILIREDSFSQQFQEQVNIHNVNFIVDIDSLKQSYSVAYQWSEEGKFSDHLDQYGTQVTCLDETELKWDTFNCVDERILEAGVDNFDPIYHHIPYTDNQTYRVTSQYKDDIGNTVLVVEPFIHSKVTNITEYILDIEDNIHKWIVSKNLKPESYVLNFGPELNDYYFHDH